MPTIHLHNRRDALCGLLCAATATVAMLGGAVALFVDAGHTPWFEPDSLAAQQAAYCKQQPSVSARHRCLRDLALTFTRDMVQASGTAPDPTAP